MHYSAIMGYSCFMSIKLVIGLSYGNTFESCMSPLHVVLQVERSVIKKVDAYMLYNVRV